MISRISILDHDIQLRHLLAGEGRDPCPGARPSNLPGLCCRWRTRLSVQHWPARPSRQPVAGPRPRRWHARRRRGDPSCGACPPPHALTQAAERPPAFARFRVRSPHKQATCRRVAQPLASAAASRRHGRRPARPAPGDAPPPRPRRGWCRRTVHRPSSSYPFYFPEPFGACRPRITG